jgi:hypothetical protein
VPRTAFKFSDFLKMKQKTKSIQTSKGMSAVSPKGELPNSENYGCKLEPPISNTSFLFVGFLSRVGQRMASPDNG